jgi:predicted HTH domain antitoxin
MMDSTMLDLGEDLSGFLATLGQPIEQTAREMIVFELYRRSLVSSGKGAELLGIPRIEFIQRTSELGIPYLRFTGDEWQAEVAESKRA